MTAEEYEAQKQKTVEVPVDLLINLWCELYYGVGGEFGIDDSISQWNLDRVVDLLGSVNSLPVPRHKPHKVDTE